MPGVLAGSKVPVDPYIANVVALLHFDGIDGGTTFTDETGKSWSQSGTATLTTTDPKFGTASLNVPASSDIRSPNHVDFEFGSGDWTVEAWIKPTSTSDYNILCYGTTYGLGYGLRFFVDRVSAGGALAIACYPNLALLGVAKSGDNAVSLNVWHHVAAVRYGSNLYLYLDGNRVGSGAIAGTIGDFGYEMCAGSYLGSESLEGQEDDLRITKGVARYTGLTYTVPSGPFQNPP